MCRSTPAVCLVANPCASCPSCVWAKWNTNASRKTTGRSARSNPQPHRPPTRWGGLAFFFGSFFLMGGWRVGSTGFAFCLLKAGYFTQIACRLRELEQAASANGPLDCSGEI